MRQLELRHLSIGRRGILTLIALLTALGLLWALGRTVDRSHAAASDSQLAADLQVARATLSSDVAAASGKASAVARLPRAQQALAGGDAAALAAVVDAHPGVVLIASSGARAGSLSPLGVIRVANVVSGGRAIGRVVAEAPLDASFLERVRAGMAAGSHDLLVVTNRGGVVAGPLPAGTPVAAVTAADVHLGGHDYRAVGAPLAADRPEVRIIALSSRGAGFLSGWRLALAAAAILAVLALVGIWTTSPPRERPVEPERRADPPELRPVRTSGDRPMAGALALLGETLGATHDVDALIDVIRDAAVEATGASGSTVVRGAADPSDTPAGSLKIPLEGDDPRGSSLVLFPPRGGFTAGDTDLARWFGVQASTALRNARLHHVVEQHALTDELTGLANRRHFITTLNAELGRAERFGTSLSVVVTDLDHFKRINDRLGHPAGDEALRAFARALGRGVRKIDLPARIGGDEFAVLLPGTGAEGARKLAERLQGLLRREQGLPRGFTASFGVAHYPQAGSAEELLVGADVCLYRAKEAGRDSIVVQAIEPARAVRKRAS